MQFFKIYFPPLLIYSLISIASHLPSSRLPSGIPDVVPHFVEYGLLSFFFIRMFRQKINLKIFISCLAFLLCLAALDEFHQYFVPSRFFSLKDLAVDGLGILAGMGIYIKLSYKSGTSPPVGVEKKLELSSPSYEEDTLL